MRVVALDDTGLLKTVWVEGGRVTGRARTQDRTRAGSAAVLDSLGRLSFARVDGRLARIPIPAADASVDTPGEEEELAQAGAAGSIHSLQQAEFGGARHLVTCDTDAVVKYWDEDAAKIAAEIKAHTSANRMRVNPEDGSHFAIGGKNCDLRIWDVSRPDAPVFKARNVRNDMLDLEVPINITDMTFIPGTGGTQIFTVSSHRLLRLYDTRKQRRPLYNLETGENAHTCCAVLHDGNRVVVADVVGSVREVDVRTGRVIGSFKGNVGSVRALSVHPTLPYLATGGLDRFVRVYNTDTHKAICKVYVKQRLNAVTFTADGPLALPEEPKQRKDKHGTSSREGRQAAPEVDAADDDMIWGSLGRVGDGVKRVAAETTVQTAEQPQKRTATESAVDAAEKPQKRAKPAAKTPPKATGKRKGGAGSA